ncbi:MAG: AAA family ATPase [Paludibacteraceae bacterium]|nr:AAA family ATPase [Paludibacteraceae bacterium]
MSEEKSSVWVEKYRPTKISTIIMPKYFHDYFNKIVESKNVPNLLLYSSTPGTGKTTIAKALVKDLGAEYIYYNASMTNSIEVLRTEIQTFASTSGIHKGKKKIVILDEADGLTEPFQKALRGFIEEFDKTCKFILTCNFIHKIIPALREGRTQEFDFNMNKPEYKQELQEQIFQRSCAILANEKVKYDDNAVRTVVEKHFPSVRKVYATLQKMSNMYPEINESAVKTMENETELSMLLFGKHLSQAREYVSSRNMSHSEVFDNLFKNFVPMVDKMKQPTCILILSKYDFQCSMSVNVDIQIAACMYELITQL